MKKYISEVCVMHRGEAVNVVRLDRFEHPEHADRLEAARAEARRKVGNWGETASHMFPDGLSITER